MNTDKTVTTASVQPENVRFDDEKRHAIAGLEYDGKRYNIKHYRGLTAEHLQNLVDAGFAERDEKQNDCPSLGEILDFLKSNSDFTAHGYIVNPNREDCRVSVEGVEGNRNRDLDAFVEMFRHADEFSVNPPRAWFD